MVCSPARMSTLSPALAAVSAVFGPMQAILALFVAGGSLPNVVIRLDTVDELVKVADARIGEDIDVLASPEKQALFDDLKAAVADLKDAREEEDVDRSHQLVESIKYIVGELEADVVDD